MLDDLHGRRAVPASAKWNLAKTLFQTIIFWSVFLFLMPAIIWQMESAVGLREWRFESQLVPGVILFVLGGSLGLTSASVMAIHGLGTPLPLDAPRRIVMRGPYRFVRNPMAIAGLAQGVAVGLMMGSPSVIGYALVGGPIWNFFVRPWEERDLEEWFGEPFRRYRQAVRCWIPRLKPYVADLTALPPDTDLPNAERKQS
jgi:protein-S-isoprenylcysteine O-methyltransferase Ste14